MTCNHMKHIRVFLSLTTLSLILGTCERMPAYGATAMMENVRGTNSAFYFSTSSATPSGNYAVIGSSLQASSATLTLGSSGTGNLAAGCVKFPTGFQCLPGASTGSVVNSISAGYQTTVTGTSVNPVVNWNNIGITSMTFADATLQTTAYPGTAGFILNTNTLQSGATFYVSSGTAVNMNATNLAVSSMTTTLPMSARKITGLANGSVSTDAAAFGQIHLMQAPVCATVVSSSGTVSNVFSITNSTVSITPTSSSSKIFVIAMGMFEIGTTAKLGLVTLLRGSTNLGGVLGMTSAFTTIGADTQWPTTVLFLDSPATTSPTVYGVAIRNNDNATTVTWGASTETNSICAFEVQ